MPGSSVCCHSSTRTKPRSVLILVFSRPMPSVRGPRPDGDQNLFRLFLDLLAVGGGVGHLDARLGLLDLLELRSSVAVDAALAEVAVEFLADLFILDRDNARQIFDDGDLAAKTVEDRAELDSHRARADDDHRLRDLGNRQHLNIGQDAVVRGKCRGTSSHRSQWRAEYSSPERIASSRHSQHPRCGCRLLPGRSACRSR